MTPKLCTGRAAIAAAILSVAAPAALAAAQNRIDSVEVDGPRVIVHGSVRPDYTVFKLGDPARLVVDLASADVTHANAPSAVHKDGIAGISVAQFNEGESRVGRVVVALEADAKYEVTTRDNDLVVSLSPAQAAPRPAAKPADAPAPAQAAPAPADPSDPYLVLTREDSVEVAAPARKLRAISVAGDEQQAMVRLEADGPVGNFALTELRNPGRLALDLHGMKSSARHATEGAGPLKGVRVARRDDGVRVVLDAEGATMPKYDVQRGAAGLLVRVGEAKPARGGTPTAIAPVAPVHELDGIEAAPQLAQVKAVDLRTDEGKTRVLVVVDHPVKFDVSRPDPSTAVLTLHGAVLPERLERNLDASALGGPVTMLSSYRAPGSEGDVKIVASTRPGTPDTVDAVKGALTWRFGGPQPVAQGQATEAAAKAGASTELDDRNYTGRRVDFNVKDIDIKNLLGAVAEISKKNIIVADDVKGTVTIKLRNVPWDQALDIILKSKGLGREEVGNIIRVAPIATLRAEQKEAAEAAKNSLALQPLRVRLIPVNYADAKNLVDRLKDTLSDRGTVSVDTRTNTLIVKDVQDALLRAEGIVRNLDTQTPEVLIESRIVEAATSFSRQVGIQWGGNVSFAPTTGNPTGLVFPNIIQAAGAADDSSAPNAGLNGVTTPNFAVNMPAPIGVNSGGGIGFVLGSAGGSANLNLRLSAAENSGTIKTISSPRAVTLDNVESSIGQGVSIPFSQTSAAGVNTTFIEARLELRVTPHVTQEGSIQMKVAVTNNQPNPQLTGANGQPSISRREARTEVLVRDGDTTVIGGIYTRRNSEQWNEVPLLSRIPILGWLFKKKAVTDDRTELLIFITPRIVNRSQSVVAAGPAGPGLDDASNPANK
ncbi:MAG TPA: type IV pilus secretin PilQ [Myxococcales bacterium]|nr:type IV pilus secretin PilQ [Myxococcales bacterium]